MSNKYLAENESVQGTQLQDKFLILTKTKGLDYKVSWDVILDHLEKQIQHRQFLREVGYKMLITPHNNHRDALKIRDDMYEYVLCNGQNAKREDYLDYCNKLGIITENFNFPDFKDGTLRNQPLGGGRPLGSFANYTTALPQQAFTLNINNTTVTGHTAESGWHNHSLWMDYHGYEYRPCISNVGWGATRAGLGGLDKIQGGGAHSNNLVSNPHNHTGSVGGGDSETAMNNVAVQIYVLAKFIKN
ncbi:hypothetical protein ABSA28_00558 [Candidatus Hepatincolaceae symbiont of Richtersius coronifer]